jgi:murein L,D-transpeptidase YafK
VVLENGHIDELSRYIRLRDTPAIISEKIRLVPFESIQEEARRVEGIVEGWKRAWEGKDILNYMDFYSRRFTSQGMDWRKWKNYKTRVARKYKRIRITLENLHLFKSNGVVLALFDQAYQTESYASRGRKRLYFIKNSQNWKIISETFENSKPAKRLPRKPPDPWRDIRGFVTAWKKAWESKDLQTYMTCYDHDFRARGMNRNAWKKYKGRLNRKYDSLDIDIADFKISGVSGNKAEVRFKQHYKADNYEDLGIKTLLLVKRGRHWKIKKETWDLIAAGSAL